MSKASTITKETLISVLDKNFHNGSLAAKDLGVSRAHISLLRKKYGLPVVKNKKILTNYYIKKIKELYENGCSVKCIAAALKKPEQEIINVIKNVTLKQEESHENQ